MFNLELTLRALASLELPSDPTLVVAIPSLVFLWCLLSTSLLPRSWTLETRSRVTSTLHAIVSTTLAVRVGLLVAATPGSVLQMFPLPTGPGGGGSAGEAMWLAHMPAARFAVAITLGYIAFDSALGVAFPDLLDIPMIIHHTLVLVACICGLVYDVGVIYMALLLVNEASTPFVNVHFVFKHWKDWRRGVNGFGMWLSYLVCRLVVNAAVGYSMFFCTTPRSIAIAPVLIIGQILMFITAQVLNTMWFAQISKGLIKQVRKMIMGEAPAASGSRTASGRSASHKAAAAVAAESPSSNADSSDGGASAGAAATLRQRTGTTKQ